MQLTDSMSDREKTSETVHQIHLALDETTVVAFPSLGENYDVEDCYNSHQLQTNVRRVIVVNNYFDTTRNCASGIAIRNDGDQAVFGIIRGYHKPPKEAFVIEFSRESHESSFQIHPCFAGVPLTKYLRMNKMRIVLLNSETELIEWSESKLPVPRPQCTNRIMMVAPTAFASNLEASLDNHFMELKKDANHENVLTKALEEYQEWYSKLVCAGVDISLFPHNSRTPDAVFPNNWFSTHRDFGGDSTLVLYPMKVPNRRLERKPVFVEWLNLQGKYQSCLDLTTNETNNSYLEGTGSLIIDHVNRTAFMAVSQRSNEALAKQWAEKLGYELVTFSCVDAQGEQIYHTNVVMCIGTTFAVLCVEGMNSNDAALVLSKLKETRHDVLHIDFQQVQNFCGNILELESGCGERVAVMSTKAFESFGCRGREFILRHVDSIVHSNLDTIERVGGGGARCSIAELF